MANAISTIISAGFIPLAGEEAAMQCSYAPETWAAPDWDSLAYYATEFRLCGCPNHSEKDPYGWDEQAEYPF
jgi:hypothetical protein